MDIDAKIARFEERSKAALEEEEHRDRVSHIFLLNHQELLQRQLQLAAAYTIEHFKMDARAVNIDLQFDEEHKQFKPKLLINALAGDLDADEVNEVFKVKLDEAYDGIKDFHADLVRALRDFPACPAMTEEAFRNLVRGWVGS